MVLKQPASLFYLSSRALGSFIAEHALLVLKKNCQQATNVNNVDNKNLESSVREFCQYFDTTIPPIMQNLVTYDTLQYIKGKNDCVYVNDLLFCMALRSHVTKFDFSDWPLEMHSMFCRNLSKLEHLQLLKIGYTVDDNLSYVLKGIKAMKKLEKFDYFLCSHLGDIAEVLCDNCPLISLTLGNDSIDDSFVSHLLKLHNLEELKIIGTNISMFGAKQLLLGLPQLKTFHGPAKFSVGPECDITTSLESVQLVFPSQKTVENLILFCPSVVILKLITCDPLDFSNVANLDYLTTLYITAPNFYLCNIDIILQRRGHQITDLGLSDMHDISWEILLNVVDTSCPNLKNLFITSIPNTVMIDVFPTGVQYSFQNLEFVILDSYSEDKTSCFIHLLCACLNIRQVYVKPVYKLCDEDIDRILSCNPLVNLQELCVEGSKVTMKSYYKLLSLCKKLRYIGSVNCWGVERERELDELEKYIKENNLNVELVGTRAFVSRYPHFGQKKRVSVMKPEYSELPQGLLFMYKSLPGF